MFPALSRSFRTLGYKIVTEHKDRHLERIRALRSFVPAAIPPNQILQEIFSNSARINFYAATREASRICCDGPKFLGEPVSGGDVGDRETIIRYLQRGKLSRRKLEHAVSTIYFSRRRNSRSHVRSEAAIGAGEGTEVEGNGAGQNIFFGSEGPIFPVEWDGFSIANESLLDLQAGPARRSEIVGASVFLGDRTQRYIVAAGLVGIISNQHHAVYGVRFRRKGYIGGLFERLRGRYLLRIKREVVHKRSRRPGTSPTPHSSFLQVLSPPRNQAAVQEESPGTKTFGLQYERFVG
ncbi:hypothetical protein RUND412_009620 [Rhizina undulata]